MSADTSLMPIPGPVDPVPVPRAATPRADGRVELVGLSRDLIQAEFEAAGLEPKQAKLRAKKLRIDERRVRSWLGPRRYEGEVRKRTSEPGVATGLAFTAVGGDILFFEATAATRAIRPDQGS